MEEQACSDMQAKTVTEKKVPNENAVGGGELREATTGKYQHIKCLDKIMTSFWYPKKQIYFRSKGFPQGIGLKF